MAFPTPCSYSLRDVWAGTLTQKEAKEKHDTSRETLEKEVKQVCEGGVEARLAALHSNLQSSAPGLQKAVTCGLAQQELDAAVQAFIKRHTHMVTAMPATYCSLLQVDEPDQGFMRTLGKKARGLDTSHGLPACSCKAACSWRQSLLSAATLSSPVHCFNDALQVRDLGGSFTAATAHARLVEMTGMETFLGGRMPCQAC